MINLQIIFSIVWFIFQSDLQSKTQFNYSDI